MDSHGCLKTLCVTNTQNFSFIGDWLHRTAGKHILHLVFCEMPHMDLILDPMNRDRKSVLLSNRSCIHTYMLGTMSGHWADI